jgi:Rieske Fe-S protein
VADSTGSRTATAEQSRQRAAAGGYTNPGSAKGAVSRSVFLSGVTAGLGGLIGAAVAVPAIGFAMGPSFSGEDWYWVDIGPVDRYPFSQDEKARNYTPVTFERTPDGGDLERRVAFVRRNRENAADEGAFSVVSNVCMHLGCPVQANNLGFSCPCHGGQYNREGVRTAGPPVRPLNHFEYQVENDHLYVGRVFATKEVGEGKVEMTDTWKDPGQPVEGLLSILYPAPPR